MLCCLFPLDVVQSLSHIQLFATPGTVAYLSHPVSTWYSSNFCPILSHPVSTWYSSNFCPYNPYLLIPINWLLSCLLKGTRPNSFSVIRISMYSMFTNLLLSYILKECMFWIYLVQFSHSVMSNSLQPHESQHARPPCPSPTPGVHSNSCPSSRWCHPAISSSVVPSSPCWVLWGLTSSQWRAAVTDDGDILVYRCGRKYSISRAAGTWRSPVNRWMKVYIFLKFHLELDWGSLSKISKMF